jgi:hypothetical protein
MVILGMYSFVFMGCLLLCASLKFHSFGLFSNKYLHLSTQVRRSLTEYNVYPDATILTCCSATKGASVADSSCRENAIEDIFESIGMNKSEKSVQEIISRFKSFAYSCVNVNFLSEVSYSKIYLFLNDSYSTFNKEQIADCLWSMGKIGFSNNNQLRFSFAVTLVEQLCKLNGHVTARQLTTGLGGAAKQSIKWANLPDRVKNDVLETLERVCQTCNDREIGNLLHTLSKLGVKWRFLSNSTQKALLDTVIKNTASLVSQQGSMAIYALGTMGLGIDQVSAPLRNSLCAISHSVLCEAFEQKSNNKHLPQQV